MIFVAKLTNQGPVLLKLRLHKNNVIVDKIRRKFLRIFLGFPEVSSSRGVDELLLVYFGNVGASEESYL